VAESVPYRFPVETRVEWALRYLRGRVDAYRRKRLTLGHVAGAVRLALRSGASMEQVGNQLAAYGLMWDAAAETVRPRDDGAPSPST
jgi:Flp pilus assembly protein CpaB